MALFGKIFGKKNDVLMRIEDLDGGDIFVYNDEMWIKLQKPQNGGAFTFYAVNIVTGEFGVLDDEAMCVKLEGKVAVV